MDLASFENSQGLSKFGSDPGHQGIPEALNANGMINAGLQVDQFRTVQQITNGGTDWRQGDTIVVRKFPLIDQTSLKIGVD